ncbi:MAG: quinone-dependent dihydroorotate dehydrogenase [Alphaproteobacteria bacterium]|nr:quinone-dependent dihydroorotate dehydrogenase [Alphaproteobacteria bacterium]
MIGNIIGKIMPLTQILHALPPELARDLTLKAIALGLAPKPHLHPPFQALKTEIFGHSLRSPIGLAAGFDKSGTVYHKMGEYGFAFTEIGSITPKPRMGNKKPRLFRLSEDQALINRMGFNNDGQIRIAERLIERRRAGQNHGMLGINLTSDPDSTTVKDSITDFIGLIRQFAPLADYLVLDISCPNTKNGRQFLDPAHLTALCAEIGAEFPAIAQNLPPIFAKLSPDIDKATLGKIMRVLSDCKPKGFPRGLIISNSTTQRDCGLKSRFATEKGGLTGRPLMLPSTQLLADLYQDYGSEFLFIGVGGIFTAADIMAKMLAGASIVQAYTGFTYYGPNFIPKLEQDLTQLLAKNGFHVITEIIGKQPQAFFDFKR